MPASPSADPPQDESTRPMTVTPVPVLVTLTVAGVQCSVALVVPYRSTLTALLMSMASMLMCHPLSVAVTLVAYVELYEVRPLTELQPSRLCAAALTAPTLMLPSPPSGALTWMVGAAAGWLSACTLALGPGETARLPL